MLSRIVVGATQWHYRLWFQFRSPLKNTLARKPELSFMAVVSSNDVKSLRELLRLTQAEFAQLLGAHPMTVSKWERGQAVPTPYQTAMMENFRTGAADEEVARTLRNILVGAGVVLAIAFLLKHLTKK